MTTTRICPTRLLSALPFAGALLLVAALGGFGEEGSAQLIPIKTVPVASGDQFLFYPSQNVAMGGVGLALPDTLGDPFSNPATGGRVAESFFFSSPTFYSISDQNGSGRSLPLGAFFTGGDWFGGGALSLQELKGADRNRFGPVFFDRPQWDSWAWPSPEPIQDLSEASARKPLCIRASGPSPSGTRSFNRGQRFLR